MVILIGLPASGKSTLAKLLDEKLTSLYPKHIIIDTDQIRTQLIGSNFDPSKEKDVIIEKLNMIRKHISIDNAIIVDDMHYYVSMRHELYEMIQNQQGIFASIYCDTPLEICLLWNHIRSNPVPDTVINDIAQKFNIPGEKYTWDKPFYIVHMEKNVLQEDIERIFVKITNIIKKMKIEQSAKKINDTTNYFLENIDQTIRNLFHHLIIQDLNEAQLIKFQAWKKQFSFSLDTKNQLAKYLAKLKPQFQEWLIEFLKSKSSFEILSLDSIFSLFILYSDR